MLPTSIQARSSRLSIALFLSIVLVVTVVVRGERSAEASVTPSAGSGVSYPLRHSFSLAVGLPGAGRHEPTSCWEIEEKEKHYTCRIVSGHEEAGDKRNFIVQASDALDNGAYAQFGHELVSRDGMGYEGCHRWRTGEHWFCDYASRNQVSREHYEAGNWVLKVFWRWKEHTENQAGCAAALSALWSGPKAKAFTTLLKACQNGPLEEPLKPKKDDGRG